MVIGMLFECLIQVVKSTARAEVVSWLTFWWPLWSLMADWKPLSKPLYSVTRDSNWDDRLEPRHFWKKGSTSSIVSWRSSLMGLFWRPFWLDRRWKRFLKHCLRILPVVRWIINSFLHFSRVVGIGIHRICLQRNDETFYSFWFLRPVRPFRFFQRFRPCHFRAAGLSGRAAGATGAAALEEPFTAVTAAVGTSGSVQQQQQQHHQQQQYGWFRFSQRFRFALAVAVPAAAARASLLGAWRRHVTNRNIIHRIIDGLFDLCSLVLCSRSLI